MPGKLITIPIIRKAYQKMPDKELIKCYRVKGDEEIIGEFFNRYVHLIYSVCYPYYHNDDKTRDRVMEIFESLGKKLKKYEIQHFKSWLYQVARNDCLMDIRKNKNEVPLEQYQNDKAIIVENESILHHEHEKANLNERLRTFLSQLKEGQRICIELMYFDDKSYKEISSLTGYSMKQVKSYIQNGKRNLRGYMENKVIE